ncbi:MAG: CarD family transcriptional regulator [Clostridia bacterium]|nr:CarD family transcriptional regulator [Clostridia bacterium]
MYKIGDMVIYGTDGVCLVEDIIEKSFGDSVSTNKYYVLVPKGNKGSKFYVPVDNPVLTSRIMKLLSYSEVLDLINSLDSSIEWIDNNKLRARYYKDTMSSYSREAIFQLAKQLHYARVGKIESVKKLYTMDEDMIRKISQLLYEEFAYVADITTDQVLPFIAGEIICPEKSI